jgi:CubicO group peptidase (beta-lactamase class C family)
MRPQAAGSSLMILLWVLLVPCMAPGAAKQQEVWPMPKWTDITPQQAGMDRAKLEAAGDFALTGGGSGLVVRGGRRVFHWGPQGKKYDLKSTTKSIGATTLGLALMDGKLRDLDTPAARLHPTLATPPASNAATGWIPRITLGHLATHTAGFGKNGGYTRLQFAPGTRWSYTDGGPNWLAECITLLYRKDIEQLLFERVFTPIGITSKDLHWRSNMYRRAKIDGIARREFGAGVHASVDAMARIGLLYLREGRWQGRQLIPKAFVKAVHTPPPANRGLPVVYQPKAFIGAPNRYGLLWITNVDGHLRGVPRDAFWAAGLYDSRIIVIPSLDLVVARAGRSWRRRPGTPPHLAGLPFIGPICASIHGSQSKSAKPAEAGPPYPPSKVITAIEWAPRSTIVRKAAGSDNWPITWADDGDLYTAYGDGWGFAPKVPAKLSLGFAKVTGGGARFGGVNIRSPSGEQKGDGRSGRKASGMLCVGGVLYMLVRNADGKGRQSLLAWSTDHARTWQWSRWRFAAFGHPVFLNFGRDYAGARDGYVYAYSPDTPDAYRETDAVALARVPRDRIRERAAYEFFVRLDAAGRPVWSKDIGRRGAAFSFPGGCNRMDVVHNAPLGRYLMTMRSRGVAGGRDQFSLYDAPEPWGPWTTVFHTRKWDVDPGEVQRIPAKWIAADGRSFHLVFAGGDAFSVRKATLTVASD